MEAHDLDNESRWDDEEKKERELAELKRLLAEKNETANTFMEQVKKLQARVFELESNNRYQRGYAAGEKDGADEARKNYTLAHANLGREVVENGNLQAQLREAIAIIDDMVNSLDGADYDRARKFLKFPVPENRPVRVPLNFTFCARCGEQMKPNDASAEASNESKLSHAAPATLPAKAELTAPIGVGSGALLGHMDNDKTLKHKNRLCFWFCLYLMVFLPQAIASVYFGQLFLDERRYMALVKWNLYVIYSGGFIWAVIGFCKECFQHPSDE